MSLQRTQEQERAAAAWARIIGCLAHVIEIVRSDVDALRHRVENHPNDNEGQRQLAARQRLLDRLRSEKGGRDWQNSFGSQVKKLPMHVLANGLGTALAFLKAKGGNDPSAEQEVLYRYISQWVTAQLWGGSGDANLLSRIINSPDVNDYRRATREALAFVVWLKRFAEAEFDAKPELASEPQAVPTTTE